jgi:hypothetical protein
MGTSTERMRRLRERRAAGLLPAEGEPPRPEDERLLPAVEETLKALQPGAEDAGTVQLARVYAGVIDQARNPAWAMRWIGPLLLDTLTALQATPASRPVAPRVPHGMSRLDKLRAVRVAEGPQVTCRSYGGGGVPAR